MTERSNTQSEEIDLFAIGREIWQLRIPIVLGILLGVALGGVYYVSAQKQYIVRFPISILQQNVPAIRDPAAIVDAFNSRFSSISNMNLILGHLQTGLPELADKINATSGSSADLVFDYFRRRSSILSLSRNLGSEDFILELRFPFGLSDEHLVSKVLLALAKVVTSNNVAITDEIERTAQRKIESLEIRLDHIKGSFRANLETEKRRRLDAIDKMIDLSKRVNHVALGGLSSPVSASMPGYPGLLLNSLQNLSMASGKKMTPQNRREFEELWMDGWTDVVNERILYSAEQQVESIFNEERAGLLKPVKLDDILLPNFGLDHDTMVVLDRSYRHLTLDRAIYLRAFMMMLACGALGGFLGKMYDRCKKRKIATVLP